MTESGIPVWEGLGNRPETTRSLNFKFGKGKSSYGYDVRIKVVPETAYELELFCWIFRERTGLKLDYNGEGVASLMNRALERLAISRRKDWSEYERKELLERQQHHCPGCGDKLSKYEIDHKKPLCRGGTNDLDNLQALCPFCHAGKTQDEQQDIGRMHTMSLSSRRCCGRSCTNAPSPRKSLGGSPQILKT